MNLPAVAQPGSPSPEPIWQEQSRGSLLITKASEHFGNGFAGAWFTGRKVHIAAVDPERRDLRWLQRLARHHRVEAQLHDHRYSETTIRRELKDFAAIFDAMPPDSTGTIVGWGPDPSGDGIHVSMQTRDPELQEALRQRMPKGILNFTCCKVPPRIGPLPQQEPAPTPRGARLVLLIVAAFGVAVLFVFRRWMLRGAPPTSV